MIHSSLPGLVAPRDARTRQVTSAGRDPDRGGTWWGMRPPPLRRKRVLIEPGQTHVMASLQGAGIITRLWMTTLLPLNSWALRGLVLRFFWDDEAEPSVECPFGDFFGAPFGRYRSYSASPMSLTNGGFNCEWPMPFSAGARLEVVNDGPRSVDPFFYQVTYDEATGGVPGSLRFHARWRRENPTLRGVPFTLVEARGAGHYVGCHLFLQNREWWLRPSLRHMSFPYGFGLGMLEGWESITVDGETEPSIVGTGSEDYAGGGWYNLMEGRSCAPHHGCSLHQPGRGRVALYRFHLPAPIAFRQELTVTLDHGFENRLECDYTAVAYWYQEEPHRPWQPLPGAPDRRPAPVRRNVLQSALVLGAPGWLGRWLLGRLRWR